MESDSITDSKSDSGSVADLATDSIVLMIEGGVRVKIVVGLGPRLGVGVGVGRVVGLEVRFGHGLKLSPGVKVGPGN